MTLDILQCCAKGDIEYLRGWIEVEEKPENLLDLKSNDGKSAMEIAACFGKQDVIEELQKLGGSLGYLSPKGIAMSLLLTYIERYMQLSIDTINLLFMKLRLILLPGLFLRNWIF